MAEGRNNLPASVQATALVNLALASYGCDPLIQSVDFPVDQADVSAQVATLAAIDADAITLDILPSLAEQIFPAADQLGVETPFAGATPSFSNASVENMADIIEGVYVAGWMPTDDFDVPGNTLYMEDFAASGAEEGLSGDTARAAWVALDLLDYAAQSAATIDRTGLLAALSATTDYDAGGMVPVLDFSKPGANPTFPRIVNLTVFPAQVKGGTFVAAGGTFVPIFGPG